MLHRARPLTAERLDTEEAVAAARTALGQEAWAAAFAAGRALSLEEAIAEALQDDAYYGVAAECCRNVGCHDASISSRT